MKKIFLADSIAAYIDPIFDNPGAADKSDLIKAYYLFPLQIYFDFSGYVDMALGASNIVNIRLPINFNKPYLSQSLTEFWHNWHMTLSRWFRDYLYIPQMPDPDLLIRTAGEQRLSNFLLYQLSYTELMFFETLWPEFSEKDLNKAVEEFSKRKRTYGKA